MDQQERQNRLSFLQKELEKCKLEISTKLEKMGKILENIELLTLEIKMEKDEQIKQS